MHRCARLSVRSSVRPSVRPSRTNCRALGSQDGSRITCISDSCRGTDSRFPAINCDRNRVRARIVGHAGRRALPLALLSMRPTQRGPLDRRGLLPTTLPRINSDSLIGRRYFGGRRAVDWKYIRRYIAARFRVNSVSFRSLRNQAHEGMLVHGLRGPEASRITIRTSARSSRLSSRPSRQRRREDSHEAPLPTMSGGLDWGPFGPNSEPGIPAGSSLPLPLLPSLFLSPSDLHTRAQAFGQAREFTYASLYPHADCVSFAAGTFSLQGESDCAYMRLYISRCNRYSDICPITS